MRKLFFRMPQIKSAPRLFLIVIACSLVSCDRNGDEESAESNPTRPVREVERKGPGRMTDRDLEKIILDRLKDDEQLKDADLHVKVNARRNEVTISGVVRTGAMRERAVDLARAARYGMVINDRIEIRRRKTSRSEYPEARLQVIRRKIRIQLASM